MSLVSDAMAWMIVLYEQYPGLFTVVIQIALLILAFHDLWIAQPSQAGITASISSAGS